MKSWKTTLAGAVGAAAITLHDIYATGEVSWQSAITAVVMAVVGYLAKDKNVTGTGK